MPIARKYRQVIGRQKQPALTALILEKIAEAGEVLIESFFPAKYPETRLWRKLLKLDPAYEFKRATFVAILSKLRAQGLIEQRVKAGRSLWRTTPKGQSAARARPILAPPKADGKRRLVCFDIPEYDRAKRQWLRGELIALGYRPLQRSVWIGESPLPPDFIKAMDTLDLRDCVHILRIESEGTLRSNRDQK